MAVVNCIRSIYLKFIISTLFLFVSFSVFAVEPKIISVSERNINQLYEEKLIIEKQIIGLNKQLKKSGELQLELNSNIEKNLKLQQEIQKTTNKLLGMTSDEQEKLPYLKVHLLQATNLSIFAFPIATLIIVLGGIFLSLRTLKITSKESLSALDRSNKNQFKINEINNQSERSKLQKSIISSNRQKWINTLRDELSSLVSHLAQYAKSSPELQIEMNQKVGGELNKIELLLNPEESLHKELIEELRSAFLMCSKEGEFKDQEQRNVILTIAKKILKQEWIRVKSFE